MDVKSTVWHYLKNAREQVLWKVEGLPEPDFPRGFGRD